MVEALKETLGNLSVEGIVVVGLIVICILDVIIIPDANDVVLPIGTGLLGFLTKSVMGSKG